MLISQECFSSKFRKIDLQDLICISDISNSVSNDALVVPFKYSFTLQTKLRPYVLYASTMEERDLWVNSFERLCNIKLEDQFYEPIEPVKVL